MTADAAGGIGARLALRKAEKMGSPKKGECRPRTGTDRVTKDTIRSREKVSSGANFVFTFSDLTVRHAAADDDKSRKNLQSFLKSLCNARDNYSMAVRSDAFESAKSHFFDTSSWGVFCDVTLTLKQARQPDSGGWVKIDDYRCRQAFRHFMNLLNSSIRSGISSIRQKASCITRA